MGKTTTYINVYQDFEILGNTNGYEVQNHAGLGHEGDVRTGGKHGDKATVIFEGRLAKFKDGTTRLVFKYRITTGDYISGRNGKGVCIGIYDENLIIDALTPYKSEKQWTEGNYLCTEKYTWAFATTPEKAYYKDDLNTKKENHGWYTFKPSTYPSTNKTQSWLSASKLQFKIDGSGDELYKPGNIGVKGQLCIRIAVTKETTRTKIYNPEELEAKRKQEILAKDQTATTIDQLMENRGMSVLEDGYKTLDNVCIPITNDSGAYLRGKRKERIGTTEYVFPRSQSNAPSTDYYPGTIVVVDSKFRSRLPKKINFKENERKPLNFITTLPSSSLTEYFDKVIPTERNLNNKRMQFVSKYSKEMKDLAVASISNISESSYENGCGITVGGSIKEVDFSLSGSLKTKSVKIFEFKQILYSISLDDTYKKASDFFTSELDLDAFKKSIGAYPAAIIDTVHYGKIAYIAVSSNDKSALSVNINGTTGTISGGTKNCKFTAFTIGGPAGYLNGVYDFSDSEDAKTFISKLRDEMTAGNASAAVPIEFEASYLANPGEKVKTDIHPYFHKYVDTVKLKISEGNAGATMTAKLKYLDRKRDMNGIMDYSYQSIEKKLTSALEIEVSPWAVCFEVRIVIAGADEDYDFNIFIPYIPLEQLQQDENGDWVFSIRFGGSTLYNAKNAEVNINPTVQGCYKSKEHNVYKGSWNEREYLNKTEDQVLTTFFDWCEREDAQRNNFVKITGDKAIKISRTR